MKAIKLLGYVWKYIESLGKGFLEIVYKDALEFELKRNNIPFEREKEFLIKYKDIILPHKYSADFIAYDKIILEIKCKKGIIEEHAKQTLNYLSVSNVKLGIIINFGEDSLKYKRIVL